MRHVYAGIATLLCIMVVGVSVFGITPNPILDARWQEVAAEYELKTSDVIPAGVTPLEIESPRALEQLLRKLNKVAQKAILVEDTLRATALAEAMESEGLTRSQESSYTIQVIHLHYDKLIDHLYRTRFNLWADVYIGYSGSFHWIDDVRLVRVALSGWHPFTQLVDTFTDSYIYPDLQRAIIQGGGTFQWFFILDGIFVYYSKSVGIVEIYRL